MELIFKEAGTFKNGVAFVKNFDGTYQYVDSTGRIIPGNFYQTFEDHGQDWFLVETKKGSYNFVDFNGNLLLENDIESQFQPRPFKNGFARVIDDNEKYSLLNNKGKIVSDKYNYIEEINNGYAGANKNGTNGFIDTKGKYTSKLNW